MFFFDPWRYFTPVNGVITLRMNTYDTYSRLQISPQKTCSETIPPQIVPTDLSIGETRVWRL